MTARHKSEQGAILVYAAVVLLVLVGVTMWVVDYGILLLARNQAQNSADAGALGGAVALAFDDYADRSDTGAAKLSAHALALDNGVIGQPPDVNITTDVYFYPDDPTKFPAVCADDSCIRVDVYRNQARGNPLPMIFGAIVGLKEQGTWATAIARATFGNASDCMLPFGIPDKWNDWYDVDAPIEPPGSEAWTYPDDRYEIEEAPGPGGPIPDEYIAPSSPGPPFSAVPEGDPVSPNTSFSVLPVADEGNLGQLLVLKAAGPQLTIAPGFFFPVRLPLANPDDPDNPLESTGGADYRNNIVNCNGVPVGIGDTLDNEPGNMVGPTRQGMQDLYDKEPNAYLDTTTNSIVDSCAQATPSCGPQSPRLRPLILFDTGVFYAGKTNGLVELRIANIIGFFLNGINGGEVSGYIATLPGLFDEGKGTVAPESAFIKLVQLIR